MDPTNSPKDNYFFPIIQERGAAHFSKNLSPQDLEIRKNIVSKLTEYRNKWGLRYCYEFTFKNYLDIKKQLKLKKDTKELLFFNCSFINFSYDNEILAIALQEFRSSPYNIKSINFIYQSIRLHSIQKHVNKAKLLIELGEDINLNSKNRDFTCLTHALCFKKDSLIKLFVTSGGFAYEATPEQQAHINKIMQPIIINTKAAYEFIKIFNINFIKNNIDFLIDLRNIICIIMLNDVPKLAPIVLEKILKLNRAI